MALRIYHEPHSRSVRVVWLMEELGEAYALERVEYPPGDAFKAMGGAGTIPAIVDGDVVMGESIAILQYLTGRRLQQSMALGLTVGPNPDPAAYAEHLQFLHLGEASLMTPLGFMARTRRLSPESEDSFTARHCAGMFKRSLQTIETQLADGRPHLTGDALTIADISVGYALYFAVRRGFGSFMAARTAGYQERLASRPAFQRASKD